MGIEAIILDKRKDGDSQCFLVKFSLFDYLNNLPENYQEYDIQREVVTTNVYLDKIIETVLNKHHIPSIVIILTNYDEKSNILFFESKDYKILDGLQRTHRLKMIFDTYKLFQEELISRPEILDLKKFQISREYSKELSQIKSNYNILFQIISYYKEHDAKCLEDVFTKNNLWFELWTNLDSSKQVEKMLLLNAGHKPVKLKHQLELLFINDLLVDFKNKEKFRNFILIREKEMNSTSFSKTREFGQFHFSHLISALIAFDRGQIIVTNTQLISQVQDNDFVIQDLAKELSYGYLNDFVEFLLDFDQIIQRHYPNANKWFGREASLVGLFAAMGKYRIENEIESPKEVFNSFIQFLEKYPKVLALESYDEARKNLDLSKINFGNVNRKVVFSAIINIMNRIKNEGLFPDMHIAWDHYFSKFL